MIFAFEDIALILNGFFFLSHITSDTPTDKMTIKHYKFFPKNETVAVFCIKNRTPGFLFLFFQ